MGLVQLEIVVLVRFYRPFNKGGWGVGGRSAKEKGKKKKKSHRMLTPAPSVGFYFFLFFLGGGGGGRFFWWHLAACVPSVWELSIINYDVVVVVVVLS